MSATAEVAADFEFVEHKDSFTLPKNDVYILKTLTPLIEEQFLVKIELEESGPELVSDLQWINLFGQPENTTPAKEYIKSLCTPETVQLIKYPPQLQNIFKGLYHRFERNSKAVILFRNDTNELEVRGSEFAVVLASSAIGEVIHKHDSEPLAAGSALTPEQGGSASRLNTHLRSFLAQKDVDADIDAYQHLSDPVKRAILAVLAYQDDGDPGQDTAGDGGGGYVGQYPENLPQIQQQMEIMASGAADMGYSSHSNSSTKEEEFETPMSSLEDRDTRTLTSDPGGTDQPDAVVDRGAGSSPAGVVYGPMAPLAKCDSFGHHARHTPLVARNVADTTGPVAPDDQDVLMTDAVIDSTASRMIRDKISVYDSRAFPPLKDKSLAHHSKTTAPSVDPVGVKGLEEVVPPRQAKYLELKQVATQQGFNQTEFRNTFQRMVAKPADLAPETFLQQLQSERALQSMVEGATPTPSIWSEYTSIKDIDSFSTSLNSAMIFDFARKKYSEQEINHVLQQLGENCKASQFIGALQNLREEGGSWIHNDKLHNDKQADSGGSSSGKRSFNDDEEGGDESVEFLKSRLDTLRRQFNSEYVASPFNSESAASPFNSEYGMLNQSTAASQSSAAIPGHSYDITDTTGAGGHDDREGFVDQGMSTNKGLMPPHTNNMEEEISDDFKQEQLKIYEEIMKINNKTSDEIQQQSSTILPGSSHHITNRQQANTAGLSQDRGNSQVVEQPEVEIADDLKKEQFEIYEEIMKLNRAESQQHSTDTHSVLHQEKDQQQQWSTVDSRKKRAKKQHDDQQELQQPPLAAEGHLLGQPSLDMEITDEFQKEQMKIYAEIMETTKKAAEAPQPMQQQQQQQQQPRPRQPPAKPSQIKTPKVKGRAGKGGPPPAKSDKERFTFSKEGGRNGLRHIVIDGSNIAMHHGNHKVFSCRGIGLAVEYFWKRGHREITVFVPSWRREPDARQHIVDQQLLDRLCEQGWLVFTPARRVRGQNRVAYDDRYVVQLAAETNGVIVSNDKLRDLMYQSQKWRVTIEDSLLMFAFAGDFFMPPDDPFGRLGPSLDQFLRATSMQPPQPSAAAPAQAPTPIGPPSGGGGGELPTTATWGGARGAPPQLASSPLTREQVTQLPQYSQLAAIFPDNQDGIVTVLTSYPQVTDLNILSDKLLETLN